MSSTPAALPSTPAAPHVEAPAPGDFAATFVAALGAGEPAQSPGDAAKSGTKAGKKAEDTDGTEAPPPDTLTSIAALLLAVPVQPQAQPPVPGGDAPRPEPAPELAASPSASTRVLLQAQPQTGAAPGGETSFPLDGREIVPESAGKSALLNDALPVPASTGSEVQNPDRTASLPKANVGFDVAQNPASAPSMPLPDLHAALPPALSIPEAGSEKPRTASSGQPGTPAASAARLSMQPAPASVLTQSAPANPEVGTAPQVLIPFSPKQGVSQALRTAQAPAKQSEKTGAPASIPTVSISAGATDQDSLQSPASIPAQDSAAPLGIAPVREGSPSPHRDGQSSMAEAQVPRVDSALPFASLSPVPIAHGEAPSSTPSTGKFAEQQAPSPVPVAPEPLPIHSARLIENAGGTEMRLGLHSSEFGSISIATSTSSGTLQASITLDHSVLGHAISAHLPAIEEKLGITARVDVRDAGAAPHQGGNPQSSPQQGGSRHRAWSPAHSISPVGIEPAPAAAAPTLRNPTARLSVLA